MSTVGFRLTPGLVSMVAVILWGSAASTNDRVVLANTSGSSNGVLVVGQSGTSPVVYKTFKSSTNTVNVGHLSASAGNNEVVAFTTLRPVAIKTKVAWTTGADTVNLSFSNQIAIPVKVWVVKKPFTTQKNRAISSSVTTSAIWNKERMGVAFSPFEIVDATGIPNASMYLAFNCQKQAGIQTAIGKTAGRINIYIVGTVDGGTGQGNACATGGDFVALGSAAGYDLMAHELGHDFALTHIDDLTTAFDETNIMHSASSTRQFITEGQLFRAHLTSRSALNYLYAARDDQPTRDCERDLSSDVCPPIQKRIWPDGAFPAN